MDGGAAARNRTAHGVLLALLLLLLLLAHGVAAPAPSPCTGTSLALPAAECNAWVEFFDSTQGLMGGWSECTENRLDPCACSYDTLPDAGVGCTRSGHIAQINLMQNNVRGSIPPSFADLKGLTWLDLQGNPGLHGLLPALPWKQYTYCALEDLSFSCPLPPGADQCKGAGRGPPTCSGQPVPVPTPKPPTPPPTPVPPTPTPPTPAPPTPAPVMYSCDPTSGQCLQDPQGAESAQACIASCKAPTPPPTPPPPTPPPPTPPPPTPPPPTPPPPTPPPPTPPPAMYSCDASSGQCKPDPQGTQTAQACVDSCKCVTPHNCGQLNGTAACGSVLQKCNVCGACCMPYLTTQASCDGCFNTKPPYGCGGKEGWQDVRVPATIAETR